MPGLIRIRAFVSVNLPDEIADRLEGFLSSRVKPLSEMRLVTRDQFHITLKFLGEISLEQVVLVRKSLSEMKFDPFEIDLTHAGVFPNFRNPKVLWLAGERGVSELTNLSRIMNEKFSQIAAIPKDDRRFKAHLTLARIPYPELWNERVFARLAEVSKLGLTWRCSRVSFMRSVLTREKAIYTEIRY